MHCLTQAVGCSPALLVLFFPYSTEYDSKFCMQRVNAEVMQFCTPGIRTVKCKWDSICPVLLCLLNWEFIILRFWWGFFFISKVVIFKIELLLKQGTFL